MASPQDTIAPHQSSKAFTAVLFTHQSFPDIKENLQGRIKDKNTV
jgi:hypothetical protein